MVVRFGIGMLAWLGIASIAHAGNAGEPRVPATFPGGACLEVLHPGDAPLHLPIGIPREDDALTGDEPPGSRTFQFFALCREPAPGEALPVWIDPSDVDTARAADPTILAPDPSSVLPTSSWAGCIVPLTDAAHRMPITCEATAEGVDIDPSAVPPGAWSIWAYTYQPAMNVWRPRPGVLRVEGTGEALGPALAFAYPQSETTISIEAGVVLRGCVAADPGTEVELFVATTGDLAAFGDDAWRSFATMEGDGALDVAYMPDPDAAHQVLSFRAVATDPAGRTATAFVRHPVIVVPGCAMPEGGREPVQDVCGVGDGTPEPTDTGAEQPASACTPAPTTEPDPPHEDDDGSTPPEPPDDEPDASQDEPDADDPSDGAVACGVARPPTHAWPALALLWVVTAMRRRRTRDSRATHARGRRPAPRPSDRSGALTDPADRRPTTRAAGA